ncbi:MAG: hypothetical protein LWY06_19525 [Firmicutes bacterium]|nr:hypothetical protein [Bacillota bacterium]
MIIPIKDILANPFFGMFLAIAVGYGISRISVRGFSPGTLGVLAAAVFLGAVGCQVPAVLKTFGFLIFIYAVGIQSGPKIFSIFKPKNYQYIAVAVVIFLFATLFAFIGAKIFGFTPDYFVGIYCGLFGNASALGNIISVFNADQAGFTFSFAYPLTLILSQIFILLLIKRYKIHKKPQIDGDFRNPVTIKNEKIMEESILVSRDKVTNGITIAELEDNYGVVITEIIKGKEVSIPANETTLVKGDIIVTQGYESDVKKLEEDAGEDVIPLVDHHKAISVRTILVTNRKVDGKTIGDIMPRRNYRCVITRIWRSGIFIAAPESWVELEIGDSVVAAGKEEDLEKLTELLGKRDRKVGEIDFMALGLAMSVGIFLGSISINIPYIGAIKLGIVGGVLVVSLLMGYSRRLGIISGQLSPHARSVLRELGMTMFIMGIGAESGAMFAHVEYSKIFTVLAASLAIALLFLLSVYATILVFKRRSKAATVLSIFCGVSTNTPALGVLVAETGNEEFMIPYASVYPISQILLIVIAQIMYLIYH